MKCIQQNQCQVYHTHYTIPVEFMNLGCLRSPTYFGTSLYCTARRYMPPSPPLSPTTNHCTQHTIRQTQNTCYTRAALGISLLSNHNSLFPVFPAYAARYPCLPTSHTVLRSSFPCSPTISAHGMNGAVYLVCASAPTTVCFRITSQATTHYQGFQQYGAGRLLQLLQLVGPMLPLLWPQ